jgi:hypothetical protein
VIYRTLLPLISLIALCFSTSGCGLDIFLGDNNQNITPPSYITSPEDGFEITDPSQKTIVASGYCPSNSTHVILGTRARHMVECQDGLWSFDLEVLHLIEGENQLTVFKPDGSPIQTINLLRKLYPDNIFLNRSLADVSSINHIDFNPDNRSIHALTYISDEYCLPLNCSTQNIIIRLGADNYQTPYYLTIDLKDNYFWPRLAQIDKQTLRVFYIREDSLNNIALIEFKDFDIKSKAVTRTRQIVSLPVDELRKSLQLEQKKSGEIFISYLSKEYCTHNSCDLFKPVIRGSQDNFGTPKYFATDSDCDTSQVRLALQENNQRLHMLYAFQRSTGTCTSWINYYNHTYLEDHSWQSVHSFSNGREPGGTEFAVDNNGVSYVFHYSTWHGGQCPGGWGLFYGSSADDFASVNLVGGSCNYQVSYPGESHRPRATTLPDDGSIALVSGRRNGAPDPSDPINATVVTTSQDGFSSPIVLNESFFNTAPLTRTISYKGDQIYVATVLYGTDDSGLHLYSISSNSISSQQRLAGPFSKELELIQTDSHFYLLQKSKRWCLDIDGGCNNYNFGLESLDQSSTIWLTQINQPDLQLSLPLYLQRADEDDYFVYTSNELDSQSTSSRYKTASDNFLTTYDFFAPTPEERPIISTGSVDGSNHVHVAGGIGSQAFYYNSIDTFGSSTQINSDSLGSLPRVSDASSNGDFALHYGANGGGWRGRLRSTLDGFAGDNYVSSDAGIRYGGWMPQWRPSGELDTYIITDINSDGRNDIGRVTSEDGFSSTSIVLSFNTASICRSLHGNNAGTPFIITKYDHTGRLYILYSVKRDDRATCELRLTRSDDWTKYWDLKADTLTSLEPKKIYFKGTDQVIACGASRSNYICFQALESQYKSNE